MKTFRIGSGDIALAWHFSKPDGTPSSLEGLAASVIIRSGRGSAAVRGVTVSGSHVTVLIPKGEQKYTGTYDVELELRQNGKPKAGVTYRGAFELVSACVTDNMVTEDQCNQVELFTVAEFELLAPVIPAIGPNGRWVVGGADTGVRAYARVEVDADGVIRIWTGNHAQADETYTGIKDIVERTAEGESARETAEAARVASETLRSAAESARVSAESVRASNESARVQAEEARDLAEDGRDDAEGYRVAAEDERIEAERGRATSEEARETAEAARVVAEAARETAEAARVSAESSRVTAETARELASAAAVAAAEAAAERIAVVTLSFNAPNFYIGESGTPAEWDEIADILQNSAYVRAVDASTQDEYEYQGGMDDAAGDIVFHRLTEDGDNLIVIPHEWASTHEACEGHLAENHWVKKTRPYISLERLRRYLYRVTFDGVPEAADIAPLIAAGCSSYVKDGKLYRNLDFKYDNAASFIVRTRDFEGMAFISGLEDGAMDDALVGQLPYRVVDGRNGHGIMVSTHVVFNDWLWAGAGDRSVPLTSLPFLVLTRVKSMATIASDLSGVLGNLSAISGTDYLIQVLVTDGTTTYAILPPTTGGQPYVLQDITATPKLTNFRWVNRGEVSRTDGDLQTRPTGIERFNAMPCALVDLRFTKAYETPSRLSEYIGESGTTKASSDAELLAVYNAAHAEYLIRQRDGKTWQTMHSVIYGGSMESLHIQEDWSDEIVGGDWASKPALLDGSLVPALADNLKTDDYSVNTTQPGGDDDPDTDISDNFVIRSTGGNLSVGNGVADLRQLKGNAVIWNQLIRKPAASWSGVKAVIGDGTIAFTRDSVSTSYSYYATVPDGIRLVKGHKYYGRCYVETSGSMDGSRVGFSVGGSTLATGRIQFYNPDGSAGLVRAIQDLTNAPDQNARIMPVWTNAAPPSEGSTQTVSDINLIDLTDLFGAGNEPATVEAVETALRKLTGSLAPYYAYDEGSLKTFNPTALKATGFNQYHNGTARLIKGQQYHIQGAYTSLTIGGETVTPSAQGIFTAPADGVMSVAGGDATTCINLHWTGYTPHYEPYEEHEANIDVSSIVDGQGNQLFPHGLLRAGTAYDEVRDGKAIKRIVVVDLGNLPWEAETASSRAYWAVAIPGMKQNTNQISPWGYTYETYAVNAKTYTTRQLSAGYTLYVRNSGEYASAAEFKAAMSGIPLACELTTPVEVDLPASWNGKYICNDFGTEEFVGTEIAPYGAEFAYLRDLKNQLRNHLDRHAEEWASRLELDAVKGLTRLDVETSFTSTEGLKPNRFYDLGTITEDPDITLYTPVDEEDNPDIDYGKLCEYLVQFTIGSGWTPAVTFEDSVVFPKTPSWEVGKTYQVSIVNHLATVGVWG